MKTYFVTGATGVVGSAIAERLLAEPDTRLKLLMRAGSEGELQQRLDGLARFWQRDPSEVRRRVEPVRGDTTLPRFGLAQERFEQIGRDSTHLIHCAAIVRMTLPIEEARAAAVGAARTLLELAALGRRAGQLEKVEVLSTVGVGGRWQGPLPERWLSESREFHNTYEQSKAEAESVVAEAVAAGLPITVHRPSMVVGESRSGRIIRFQIFYHIAEFLTGVRTGGLFPPLNEATIDLIPVDTVAASVVWSSTTAATTGRVLHLCSGPEQALPLVELRARIREAFSKAGMTVRRPITLPVAAIRAALPIVGLFLDSSRRRALNTLPVFLDYLAGVQSFANTGTRALLGSARIPIPAPRDYLGPVLEYYLARRTSVAGPRADG